MGFFDFGDDGFGWDDALGVLDKVGHAAQEIKGTFGDNNTGASAPGLSTHSGTSASPSALDAPYGGLSKGIAPVYVVGGVAVLALILFFTRK